MIDPTFELRVGDVREQLRLLPDDSVHAVVTSPPYWQLRDYGTEHQVWGGGDPVHEHEWGSEMVRSGGAQKQGATSQRKGRSNVEAQVQSGKSMGSFCACGAWRGELGQEPSPQLFVEHLVEVFEEVRRVLRSDGVCFVNIDDSYVGGGGGNYSPTLKNPIGGHGHPANVKNRTEFIRQSGVKAKNLALVPQRLAIALQDAGWWVRCDVLWTPPNTMPESVTDRPSRAHEYVWMLTKQPRYFWDQEAVKEPAKDWSTGGPGVGIGATDHYGGQGQNGNSGLSALAASYKDGNGPTTRNLRSVWSLATENFYGAHYAVMPVKLASRMIEAATSERGCCAQCGSPVLRVVERNSISRDELPIDHPGYRPSRYADGKGGDGEFAGEGQRYSDSKTLGWEPGCSCGADTVPCMVLDPFGGACTTAVAARRLGRSSIAIELSPDAAAIGAKRMEAWWKDSSPKKRVDEAQFVLEV